MESLHVSTRLKMKRDTFFLPDSNGNVYFRNNVSSFQMKGQSINQWIEKLTPMFNGEHTLGELTDGLPDSYKSRVFEIATILYENGFAKDVSEDHPHQLSESILKKYASQIEFLDNFHHSGAYRFQQYRQSNILAVGSGSIFLSLISSLLESGIKTLYMMGTNTEGTNMERLHELIQHGKENDPELLVYEVPFTENQNMLQRFDCVLYVSEKENVDELRKFHCICKEQNKMFFPALCINGVGLAGPLVHEENKTCWESAWHRIHASVFPEDRKNHAPSSTAEALLANVAVFECFKKMTGITKSSETNRFFLLNLETLEGNWHSFATHPFVTESIQIQPFQDFEELAEKSEKSNEEILRLHPFISKETGVFHIWEEGDLIQLPLAQCRVQVADLLSEGPAHVLSEIICSGFTHTEARCEAGLCGIEAYVAHIIDTPQIIGVGVGVSKVECVYRGLQHYLDQELKRSKEICALRVCLEPIEDKRSRFYFEALKTMCGEPLIAFGEPLHEFPVALVQVRNQWYASVGFSHSIALQRVLERALKAVQNGTEQEVAPFYVFLQEDEPTSVVIPSSADVEQKDTLQSVMQTLQQQNKQLSVFDITLGEEWEQHIAGIVTVSLREEDA
ncbi:bacteriocin maturation protein [Bacillus manliponensis]|uniref:Bacteriocin maturation protein n=1 Tax=Bacillus manliponensis TaxID=574376 RepID=A0A073JWG2_9BACI|nr:putative thiazole-containing bacteriocin maturation protein [Bacillus manliponensis]KEK18640.1 bacteriocin maturation protein [Bacillus manliponensis]